MKKVYYVNTCNIWKNHNSFALIGIFTNRRKLNPVLNKFLKSHKIEWKNTECKDKFVNSLKDYELNTHLHFVSIELINLNEVQ